jgi:hypothetical protein
MLSILKIPMTSSGAACMKTQRVRKRQSWRYKRRPITLKKVWALAKWARSRSHCNPEPPKIPSLGLKPDQESEPIAFRHSKMTDIFRKQFFPKIDATLGGIQERTFDDDTFGQAIEIDSQHPDNTRASGKSTLIKRASPWKAPGRDGIPTGFLKHAENHCAGLYPDWSR